MARSTMEANSSGYWLQAGTRLTGSELYLEWRVPEAAEPPDEEQIKKEGGP